MRQTVRNEETLQNLPQGIALKVRAIEPERLDIQIRTARLFSPGCFLLDQMNRTMLLTARTVSPSPCPL
ncbi:MAG: hypothetical protein JJ992_20340, partial [Planctomycetes bacterium]|nr:hypothetical protein [Planctomycetota bacterium]